MFTRREELIDGNPQREDASTSYVGAIETAERFGHRIYQEFMARGGYEAKEQVISGDGAPWI